MKSIRVQNLRCLADTGTIPILPITVFVGANSSGKSTLLRVFPLLKQSAETRTQSGILLNEGDVNFGFFLDALHKGSDTSRLKFEFGIELQANFGSDFLLESMPVSIELQYKIRSKDSRYPYVCEILICLGDEKDDKIVIMANEDGKLTRMSINSYLAGEELDRLRLKVVRGTVPTLFDYIEDFEQRELEDGPDVSSSFEKKLLQVTKSMFYERTSQETRLGVLRSIKLGSRQSMLNRAQEQKNVRSWHQTALSWIVDSPNFELLRNLIIGNFVRDLLSGLNVQLTQLARSVHYFKPVRASVERDYLSRDIQVSSVDSGGGNVAIFLSSLTPSAIQKFRLWMLSHFGFEVYPVSIGDGARVTMRMKEANSAAEFNLADMGFGFSQMLPFLVQIWYVVELQTARLAARKHSFSLRGIPSDGYIIAIEQPELHLHPALQAKLADVFVSMVKLSKERKLPIRFLIETHSTAIIESIGANIENGSIESDQVQILLFERGLVGKSRNSASVRTAVFDKQGVLTNWPFGFLSANPV